MFSSCKSLFFCSISLLCLLSNYLSAEPTSLASSAPTFLTPELKQILALIDQGHFIRAKTKLKADLKKAPRDSLRRFALARVYHHGEGSLPRALNEIKQAKSLFIETYGPTANQLPLVPWLRRIWVEEIQLLGELDRRTEQLNMMKRHDEKFSPKLQLEQIWPLMKLKRYDKAMQLVNEGIHSPDIDKQVIAYNGWLALEFERGLTATGWEICEQAIQHVGHYSCIIAMNAAESAFAVGAFDRVEELVSMAKRAERQDCPIDPTIHLATLYMAKGDYARASNAVRTTRAALSGDYRLHQQFSAFVKLITQRLLLMLGHWDSIYEHSLSMVGDPDRVGMVSYSAEAMDISALIDHLTAIRATRGDLEVRWRYASLFTKAKLLLKKTKYALRAWYVRQQVTRKLRKSAVATRYLKPYLSPIASWNFFEIADLTGYTAVTQLRSNAATNMQAYYDAMLAYGHWHRHPHNQTELDKANKLGEQVLNHLPEQEHLLQQRLKLILAHIAHRRGQHRRYTKLVNDILQQWPVAPRLYQIPISVTLTHNGQLSPDQIKRFTHIIDRSPLLNAVPTGQGISLILSQNLILKTFEKEVLHSSKSVKLSTEKAANNDNPKQVAAMQACFIDTSGQQLSCGQFDLESADKPAAAIAFHKALFSPRVDLSQRDIFGLDGSAVSGSANDIIKDLY